MADILKLIVQALDKPEQMGSLARAARMSSWPVVESVELVYLGCLIVTILTFPLRPVDYTDMFRYADPAASLLDPMMSDMIFAIANNDSYPIEEYSLTIDMDMVAMDNKKLLAGSRRITRLFLTYKSEVLYKASTSYQKEISLERFLNTSNVKVKGEKEDDKEVMDLFSSMNLNTTVIHYENYCEAYGRGSNLSSITIIPQYGLFGADTNESKLITHIYMILGVIVGIIIGSLSVLSWKYIKNLVCLGSKYETQAFNPFRSTMDESHLTDQNLYEMLLQEAILVSSGSSAKVYRIKFFELECAMKVFFSHARMDLRRESVIVANLDHPNIIKFFCWFRKSFIIMELMDEDLYSFIKKIQERTSDYNLPLEVALDVMLQIAEGMSYLHEEGIAHQDLKSLNIFLKLQGEPRSSNFRIIAKIADFGSARTFDPRHPRGFFLHPVENIGTRSWRAPELFPPRGGFLTKVFGMACEILPKPLDIYGFAIICSELLTKQIPFSNTNEQRIVHGVELRAGLRPTLPSHGCPKELIALIEDCWHTNPQSRPEFREICTRLGRLIEVQSHEQTPSTL